MALYVRFRSLVAGSYWWRVNTRLLPRRHVAQMKIVVVCRTDCELLLVARVGLVLKKKAFIVVHVAIKEAVIGVLAHTLSGTPVAYPVIHDARIVYAS